MAKRQKDRTGGHQDGAVFAEYAVLLALVSVGLALSVAAVGVPLVNMFRFARAVLVLPIP